MNAIRFFAWLWHALAWKCDLDNAAHQCCSLPKADSELECVRARHHPGFHWNGHGALIGRKWRAGREVDE